jgi:hypothetical protein
MLIKGAFVEFTDTFTVPMPNVVVFQFNPETMQHTWEHAEPPPPPTVGKSNPLAVRGVPGETFNFELVLDAADMITDGGPLSSSLAKDSGVYTRLAALEMLLHPVGGPTAGGLLGTVSAAVGGVVSGAIGGVGGFAAGVGIGALGDKLGGSAGQAKRPVPQSQVPTVLFVWGTKRIVPVRVNSLSIQETLFDSFLAPTHATATVEVRVLTPDELTWLTGPLKDLAKTAYKHTLKNRQSLAVANLGNAAESIIGMLPL